MNQYKTIEKIKSLIPSITGVKAALLYGSFGRNEANANSDIDMQLLVDDNFIINDFKEKLQQLFLDELIAVNQIKMRDKVVVYFKNQPKLEMAICKSVSEIERNYLGSEINTIENTIVFENKEANLNLSLHLQNLVQHKNQAKTKEVKDTAINDLIEKFVYEFESCSNAHRRSDGYHFYFFYNIALHVALQLNHISKGFEKYNFLPKNYIAEVLSADERDGFYELNGSLFLPEANKKKRKLLDYFYNSIENLIDASRKKELTSFCEWIYERDLLWNFRDISLHNPKIKNGFIYRTATLSLFEKEAFFSDFIDAKNIKYIIDLRADREIEALPYSDDFISKIKYTKAQLDPWNQPDWFKEKYNYGSNEEIAYRFFLLACKTELKRAFETLLEAQDSAVAIHCHAGKDRTGIFISMVHLLIKTPLEIVYNDYLASESDTKKHNLDLVLEIINQEGGIENYLRSCGLTMLQIEQLKNQIVDGNQY